MTKIKLIYDNNIIIGFRMEGHAGFNPGGPDILCASLSTASQMTINGILDWTGLSVEDIVKESDMRKAILHVCMPSNLHESITVQQLFRSFELYVEQLSEHYGEYVSLDLKGDKKDDM